MEKVSRIHVATVMSSDEHPVFVRRYRRATDAAAGAIRLKTRQTFAAPDLSLTQSKLPGLPAIRLPRFLLSHPVLQQRKFREAIRFSGLSTHVASRCWLGTRGVPRRKRR
jgi:hypothetical protein